MKPISAGLRIRSVTVYEETNVSSPKVAARFCVSESSVRRVVKQGTVMPQPHGGGPRSTLDDTGVTFVRAVADPQGDASQDEVRVMIEAGEHLMVIGGERKELVNL